MPNRKRTVLSVDDDETNQLVMTSFLEGAGFEVIQIYSGQECLDHLENSFSSQNTDEIPDLVLLDVMMPGIDGFETCHQIRLRFPATLPIIMVSAKISLSEKIKALSFALANDYLTKPFDRALMLAKIEARITLSEAIRDTASSMTRPSVNLAFENACFQSLTDRLKKAKEFRLEFAHRLEH